MRTIAGRWRLLVWAMLQTGPKLCVGRAPESHLNYQVGKAMAPGQCADRRAGGIFRRRASW